LSEQEARKLVELLEKSLMVQLFSMAVPQGQIAKMLGKSKSSVNEFLKPLAKKG
jgi:Mn-dependent DtxR family transcriptional regulator